MAEIGFELFNNQLMQQLVGEADSNLRLIEKMLNVEILSFGNQITIKGAAGDVENAQAAIETLYHKASKGIAIGELNIAQLLRFREKFPVLQDADDFILKNQ